MSGHTFLSVICRDDTKYVCRPSDPDVNLRPTVQGELNIKSEMRSFKSNENIHKKEGGSYYVVSANKASSVTLCRLKNPAVVCMSSCRLSSC